MMGPRTRTEDARAQPRRPPGGPDPLLVDRIATLVRHGAPLEVACRAARVAPSTVRYWLREGNRGRSPYAALALAIRHARAARDQELDALLAKYQTERKADADL